MAVFKLVPTIDVFEVVEDAGFRRVLRPLEALLFFRLIMVGVNMVPDHHEGALIGAAKSLNLTILDATSIIKLHNPVRFINFSMDAQDAIRLL